MSHPLVIPFHLSGRSKSHALMYFRMCARALVAYRQHANLLNDLDHLDPRYTDIYSMVDEASVAPVVYAGMCLEATLYDLSVCLFGDEFVEHTDKLDPLAKFFVIGQLIDRQPPSKASITYQTIQTVVSARNKLVHSKSYPGIDELNIGKVIGLAQKQHDQHMLGITASFRALVLLSLYFDGNIFEELRILPSFKKREYWIDLVPKELHEDVKWCINSSRKERQHGVEK